MKILLVNTMYKPFLNGPVRYIENLAREFAKMGHEVTIFAGSKNVGLKNDAGAKLILFKEPYKHDNTSKCFNEFLKNARAKIDSIKYENYDLIISKTHALLPLLKEFFDNRKIMFVVPALMSISKQFRTGKEISQSRNELIYAMKDIKVVALSYKMKKQIISELNVNRKNIEKINIGVNLEKFSIGKKKKDCALYLGRISSEKNIGELVRAFSLTNVGFLWIVGSGSREKEVRFLSKKLGVSKRVLFFGEQRCPSKFYRKSKLFVLTSTYDTFPLVLLEAMASGLPCIAFKPDGKKIVTASDEIITNGENGFLVKNTKEMADRIEVLLKNDDLRERMGRNARKNAEKYSWRKCALKVLKFSKQ